MTSHKPRDTATHDRPGAVEPLLPAGIRFVEFFGLPGIGKTSTSRLFASRLRQSRMLVDEARQENSALIVRQIDRIALVLPKLFNREFRSLAARIARFVAQGGQETLIDLFRVTWNLWTVAAYIRDERSRGGPLMVLDQGLLQGFFSVLLKNRDRTTSEEWLDILSAFGVDDFVFVDLRGGIDVAHGRLQTRGDRISRLQRAAPNREATLRTKADRAYRKITAEISKRSHATGSAPLLASVDVDSSISPEQVADQVLQAVLHACSGGHRATNSGSQ